MARLRLGGIHRHANGQEGGPNANASSLRGIVPHFALDSTVTQPKVWTPFNGRLACGLRLPTFGSVFA